MVYLESICTYISVCTVTKIFLHDPVEVYYMVQVCEVDLYSAHTNIKRLWCRT